MTVVRVMTYDSLNNMMCWSFFSICWLFIHVSMLVFFPSTFPSHAVSSLAYIPLILRKTPTMNSCTQTKSSSSLCPLPPPITLLFLLLLVMLCHYLSSSHLYYIPTHTHTHTHTYTYSLHLLSHHSIYSQAFVPAIFFL